MTKVRIVVYKAVVVDKDYGSVSYEELQRVKEAYAAAGIELELAHYVTEDEIIEGCRGAVAILGTGNPPITRKVMEALDQLIHDAVICQRQGVFFTVRSGRAEKALLCKVVKLGKNFAFVMLEDETSDIFIPGRFTRGAMPGDEVLVEKFEHPRVEGSDEGAILAVLTEKNDLVGTARRIEGRLEFVPDDCPAISMQLMRNCEGGAKDGDKVAVEILMRGSRQEDHRVGVAMRFGSSDEAKRCAKALLYARDIHTRFPDKVREEAK